MTDKRTNLRVMVSCKMWGEFLLGNAFNSQKGAPGFCRKIQGSDTPTYKYKIVNDLETIPVWCPIQKAKEMN